MEQAGDCLRGLTVCRLEKRCFHLIALNLFLANKTSGVDENHANILVRGCSAVFGAMIEKISVATHRYSHYPGQVLARYPSETPT